MNSRLKEINSNHPIFEPVYYDAPITKGMLQNNLPVKLSSIQFFHREVAKGKSP